MGLGKTVQIAAFFAGQYLTYIKNGNHDKFIPHLIVCPATLLSHWQETCEKFCPFLKVFKFYRRPVNEVFLLSLANNFI